jgi:hypothetical protein
VLIVNKYRKTTDLIYNFCIKNTKVVEKFYGGEGEVNRSKTQREFVVVTLIALISIALVIAVYATLLGTYTGSTVTVVSLNGEIKYDDLNSTTAGDWALTLGNIANGSTWYALFNTTSGGYNGNVNMTWTLQWSNGTAVPGATQTTNNFALTGSAGQVIYASDTGDQSTNKNWGQYTTDVGTYQIELIVITA